MRSSSRSPYQEDERRLPDRHAGFTSAAAAASTAISRPHVQAAAPPSGRLRNSSLPGSAYSSVPTLVQSASSSQVSLTTQLNDFNWDQHRAKSDHARRKVFSVSPSSSTERLEQHVPRPASHEPQVMPSPATRRPSKPSKHALVNVFRPLKITMPAESRRASPSEQNRLK